MNTRLAQSLLVIWIVWILCKSDLWASEPWLLLPSVFFAALACWPAIRWIGLGAVSIPLGEAYSLLHIPYYLLPLLDEREAVFAYPPEIRWKALLAACLFLGCFQLVYFLTMRPSDTPRKLVWQRRLREETESKLVWMGLILWCAFEFVITSGLVPDLGKELNVVRSVFSAAGMFAVFNLSHRLGRGALVGIERMLFFAGLFAYLFMDFTTGFL